MFNLNPVGKYKIQVCGTTPCWLRGADKIMKQCKNRLKIKEGETTADDKFTLVEVECLGACSNAPVVQINDDYYYDLNESHIEHIIDQLEKGQERAIKKGSQTNRQSSKPLEVIK